MLEFCARHNIETVTENYKMSQIMKRSSILKA